MNPLYAIIRILGLAAHVASAQPPTYTVVNLGRFAPATIKAKGTTAGAAPSVTPGGALLRMT